MAEAGRRARPAEQPGSHRSPCSNSRQGRVQLHRQLGAPVLGSHARTHWGVGTSPLLLLLPLPSLRLSALRGRGEERVDGRPSSQWEMLLQLQGLPQAPSMVDVVILGTTRALLHLPQTGVPEHDVRGVLGMQTESVLWLGVGCSISGTMGSWVQYAQRWCDDPITAVRGGLGLTKLRSRLGGIPCRGAAGHAAALFGVHIDGVLSVWGCGSRSAAMVASSFNLEGSLFEHGTNRTAG